MSKDQLREQLEKYEAEFVKCKNDFMSDGVISDVEQQQLDVIERIINVIRQALGQSETGEAVTQDSSVSQVSATSDPVVPEDREWAPDEDLADGRDGDEVFEEDYMDQVMETTPTGSDSPDLNEAMENLLKSPGGRNTDQYLQIIANETGMSLSQSKAQYKKFLALQQQQRNSAAKTDYPLPEPIDEAQHGSYMGSTASLRYGKMVGDHFGVNPVFGAMLNPTGGIVGSSNDQLYDADPDDPIIKHGVAHDAAGYLLNYHGDGPGYDYLGKEGRDTNSEYVGQQAGINYWLDKDNKHDLTSEGMRAAADTWGWGLDRIEDINDAYDTVTTKAEEVYEWTKETGQDAYEWADETAEEGKQAVGEAWDELVETGGKAVDRLEEKANKATDWAADKAAEVGETTERAVDSVVETGERVVEAAEEVVESVAETGEEVVEWASDTASDTASDVAENVADAAETAWDTANDTVEYADEKLEEAAEFISSLW